MRTNEDRNWDIISSALAAESSGRSPRLFSSRRTLFGIPSALDQEMAKLDEQAAEAARKAKAERATSVAAGTADAAAAAGAAGATGVTSEVDETSKATASKSGAHRVVHPLAPVFDEHSRVLILGTMPSPKSRETGFYYNHPQNRFWKVLAALFEQPVPTTNEAKEALARNHGIALWDVLAACSIEGAADGTIAACEPNDIAWLLDQAPIEAVFCTGAKATELYRKYCEPTTNMACVRLPSTSPANASVSLQQLIEAYRQILPFCDTTGRQRR